MIPFFDINITDEMINAASNALRNEKLVLGESVFKFEEEFAKYIMETLQDPKMEEIWNEFQ